MSIFFTFSRTLIICFLFLLATTALSLQTQADKKPYIVTSIVPLALIVRDLMGDKATITPLITGHASAHHFSLTLSNKKQLQRADSVIWIGPSLEQFLIKSLKARDKQSRHNVSVLALLDLESASLNETAHSNHKNSHEHHQHNHSESNDPHIWTSPILVDALYTKLAKILIETYPHLADTVNRNAASAQYALSQTYQQGRARFKEIGTMQPFYVYHNALSHFIHAFDLHNPLAFTQVPNESISGKQLRLLYKQAQSANCLIHDINETQKAEAYAHKLALKTQSIDLLATKHYASYANYMSVLLNDVSGCFTRTAN